MARGCLLLILDGLGDRGHPCLNGLTPLQAASTPNLDRIAACGENGLFHPGAPGQAFPSEKAHFALFGYSQNEFPGRGLLEALGEGLQPGTRDVSLLARLGSVSERQGCLFLERERPSDVSEQDTEDLLAALPHPESGSLRMDYHPLESTLGILLLSGWASAGITDTNPMLDGTYLPELNPREGLSEEEFTKAENTARELKSYLLQVYRAWNQHPVNINRKNQGLLPVNAMLTQRPGKYTQAPPLLERYGLQAASVASGRVYKGLADFLGFNSCPQEDSEYPDSDLARRIETAVSLLDEHDLVHVHTKAPDSAAHRKDPQHKKEIIQALDKGLNNLAPERIEREDLLLAVTSDHSTPSSGSLIHSGEPVPLALLSAHTRRDEVASFQEVACAKGSLGLLQGRELIYTILNWLDRAKLAGIMDTPRDQPFWPGKREPFRTI